jgi:hypothetical protein
MPAMSRHTARRASAAAILPILLLSSSGCDVITADFRNTETSEWRKTYELARNGRVDISNVNGKIIVEPSTGNVVEVVALKTAKGSTPSAAKEALGRIEIREDVSPTSITIATKLARTHSWFDMGGAQVKYTVRVPSGAEAKFTTVNGGVEVSGLTGRVTAEATNGGVVARNVSGRIDASTTNGGVDVDLARVEDDASLHCTNGGIRLRLPANAKASINASVTNGGIDASGLSLQTTTANRRRLEGLLNGGGPTIRISGTNGGITISAR